MLRLITILMAALWLTGCASSAKVPVKVHHINSLASVNGNDGGFKGLEYLADPIPGKLKNRVNIIYLHGIGWTEDRTKGQLADDFLGGIAKAYNLEASDGLITTLCGEKAYDAPKASPHIYVKADEPTYFDTALPGSKLKLDELVCMDKQTLNIDDNLEFVVYRVFWDNIFWDNVQFAHVGQDDNRGSSQDIAGLRRKHNRVLKDDLVNYGFSDAARPLMPPVIVLTLKAYLSAIIEFATRPVTPPSKPINSLSSQKALAVKLPLTSCKKHYPMGERLFMMI